MIHHEAYLRVKDAAALLSVSPNTIRAWGADGKIPEYRHPVNNYRLYKQSELARIMSSLARSKPKEVQRPVKKRAK